MSDWESAVDFVMRNEGGYTVDNGGPTKYGLTASYLNVDPDSIKNITQEEAREEYKNWFYRGHYNVISNQDLATRVFDFSVNAGDRTSIITLQSCVPLIEIDGIMGPKTLHAVNDFYDQSRLLIIFKNKRSDFYKSLANNNPMKYQKYLNGWIKRAYL